MVPANSPDYKLVHSKSPDYSLVPINSSDCSLFPSNSPDCSLVPENSPDYKLVPENSPNSSPVAAKFSSHLVATAAGLAGLAGASTGACLIDWHYKQNHLHSRMLQNSRSIINSRSASSRSLIT